MLMMIMLDYVNLLVEYDIMSMSILSHKDLYYTFIPSSYVCIGCGGGCDIYIYIYEYNWFVILYNDGVVLVWMIEYRHPTHSILCWLSSYLQKTMTTRSFTVAVHVLVVVLIVDCYMHVYMYILVQFVDTTLVAFLLCMFMVCCIVLQLIRYCMVEQQEQYKH